MYSNECTKSSLCNDGATMMGFMRSGLRMKHMYVVYMRSFTLSSKYLLLNWFCAQMLNSGVDTNRGRVKVHMEKANIAAVTDDIC